MSIAVVDADAGTRARVVGLLAARGHEVAEFEDGELARFALLDAPPTLLITESALPRCSGLELVARLREAYAQEEVSILVVSSQCSESDILRAFGAGADSFLKKPFGDGELLGVCGAFLARRGARPTRRVALERPLAQGLVLGGYRVQRKLGSGAYGSVYLAEDARTGLRVALKVLLEGKGQAAENRLRFLRESYVLSTLSHPHVVDVLGFGEEDGRLFCAMSYVEGPTLGRLVDQGGTVDPAAVESVLVPLLSALDALDSLGFVHRDIKPDNVILAGGDLAQPVLVDFGLAKAAHDRSLTDPWIVMGTPGYIPPEVCKGAAHDHQGDLFSLGVLICYLLTGQEPFPALRGPDLMERMAQGPIPLPPRCPAPLRPLLRSLLQVDPRLRCSSARAALEQVARQREERGSDAGTR